MSRFAAGSGARLAHGLLLVAALSAAKFGIGVGVLAPAITGPGPGKLFGGTPESFAVVALVTLLTVGGVLWLGLLRFGSVGLVQLGWRGDRILNELPWGLAGCVAAAGVTFASLSYVAGLSLGDALGIIGAYSPAQRVLFLIIGLQSAFTVETIFRGYLLPELEGKLGPILGVAATAALFAVYHVNFHPEALLAAFTTNLVFGALRVRSGGLLTGGGLAHVLYWFFMGPL